MPHLAAPVTMNDIATRLRLSVMTVSRALRNVAGVKPATRQRIHDAAKSLNYRPDPALAVLNRYRHGRRRTEISEKVAFVTNFPTADGWRRSLTFVRYFEGVRKRAQQLGYDVEPFWLGAPGLSARRASAILHGRGVRGIVIGPLAQGHSRLELVWEWFSAVAVGRSLELPGLTTVSVNHAQAMELAYGEALRRGYQRIGFAVTHGEEARTNKALRASYLVQQERSDGATLPPLVVPDFSADAIASWAAEHRPDILLTSEQTHYELLQGPGRRRARGIGFVHLNIDPAEDHAGVDQGHDLVGEHAAALLHLKLIQRETGVPLRREMLLIHGTWHEGRGRWALRTPARAESRGRS